MAKSSWGQYELLRPAQIDEILRHKPIAYLPWGALEWHSYHNPIGLDGIKAHSLCKALAKETGGVVLPPVYIGTDTIKPLKGFPHTLEHSAESVERLCTEFLEQLASEGFKVLVVVTGHYGGEHVKAVKKSTTEFSNRHPDIGLWAFPDSEPLEGLYPANHAARGETSFQLLFMPELVDQSLLPSDRETTLDKDGVWGEDPRKATAEAGAEMLKAFLQNAVPKINELLDKHVK